MLPTGWCRARSRNGVDEIALGTLAAGIGSLEVATNLGFGAARRPLLVSVRSGGAVSMPGMLGTGPERRPEHADSRQLNSPHRQSADSTWDGYRHLVQGYAEVVEALPAASFDALVNETVAKAKVSGEYNSTFATCAHSLICCSHSSMRCLGRPFPQDPNEQLLHAVKAVLFPGMRPKRWRIAG